MRRSSLRSLAGPTLAVLFLSSSLIAHAAAAATYMAPQRPTGGAHALPVGMASQGAATGVATRALIAAHSVQGRVATTRAGGAVGTPTGMPERVDLSASAPRVADQGALDSCASWSFGYYLRGYYAIRDGYYPGGSNAKGEGGFAAGYLYSQLAGGHSDAPTSAEQNVDLLTAQGIVANADYPQGNDQVAAVPTASQTALATRYRIAGHRFIRSVPGSNRQQIESLLAAGNPVVLSIALTDAFYRVGPTTYLFDGPGAAGGSSHDIAAFGYDSVGVWVENSWGTGWGRAGWAELSWRWLETQGLRFIDTITPLAPAPPAAGTPAAAPTAGTGAPGPGATNGAGGSSGAALGVAGPVPTRPAGNLAPTMRQFSFDVRRDGTYSAHWRTDQPTSGQAFWRDAGNQYRATPLDRVLRLAHTISLPGLVHGHRYTIWVRGVSAGGRIGQSAPHPIVAP